MGKYIFLTTFAFRLQYLCVPLQKKQLELSSGLLQGNTKLDLKRRRKKTITLRGLRIAHMLSCPFYY